MRETPDLIEKYGAGSSPSEAHCEGWEGLGKDGREPALRQITSSSFITAELEMLTFKQKSAFIYKYLGETP
jgi:hypothetical protein